MLAEAFTITVDFPRKIGSLDKLGFWKCTEFRQFLLYVGPLATEGIDYANRCLFMYLFVGIYIFVQLFSATTETLICYGDADLQLFVAQLERLYGVGEMVKKVHSLTYLIDDDRRYGPKDGVSAFA